MEDRPFESIEQDRDGCFSEVEIYYDAQDKIHGAIEWEIIDSVKNEIDLVESTKQRKNDYFSKVDNRQML